MGLIFIYHCPVLKFSLVFCDSRRKFIWLSKMEWPINISICILVFFFSPLLHPNQYPLLYIMYCWWLSGRESACNAGDPGSIPGLGRFPWRRAQKSTPVSLPGKFHGQRSLAGYSPQECRVGHDWSQLSTHATQYLSSVFIFKLYSLSECPCLASLKV